MVIRLPHDKCSEFRGKDVSVLNSLGSSRKTIESLMGSMAFCAQFCDEACFGKNVSVPSSRNGNETSQEIYRGVSPLITRPHSHGGARSLIS